MNRRQHSVTLFQATQDSPTLAKLTELSRDSVARLKAIESLIPGPLRSCIKAGPIEGPVWCLILENNSAAAKVRQLLPAMAAHLRVKGWDVDSIRLKVQMTRA
jgi:hypothetical protein